jgi:hypothetical protein
LRRASWAWGGATERAGDKPGGNRLLEGGNEGFQGAVHSGRLFRSFSYDQGTNGKGKGRDFRLRGPEEFQEVQGFLGFSGAQKNSQESVVPPGKPHAHHDVSVGIELDAGGLKLLGVGSEVKEPSLNLGKPFGEDFPGIDAGKAQGAQGVNLLVEGGFAEAF